MIAPCIPALKFLSRLTRQYHAHAGIDTLDFEWLATQRKNGHLTGNGQARILLLEQMPGCVVAQAGDECFHRGIGDSAQISNLANGQASAVSRYHRRGVSMGLGVLHRHLPIGLPLRARSGHLPVVICSAVCVQFAFHRS